MIRAIIFTIFGGVTVGVMLLWIEYSFFIPYYNVPEATSTTPMSFHQTPGKIFHDYLQDGNLGPEMVLIPAGQFQMRNTQDKNSLEETAIQNVFVNRFAIGRYEVTFEDYDRFVKATGQSKPDDEGWGRGNRPVMNVSWLDAIAYTKWLTQQTGKQYRLPTEAEWEYAARSNTDTQYWWGNEMRTKQANCDGCGSRWDNKKTAPVGSFTPNSFNLYDTVGNVYEWTCSEYEDKYTGKEQCCFTSMNQNIFHVIRGGSWYSLPNYVRTASRFRRRIDKHDFTIGFRVARNL
ncbi:MAG: formylglycine-generating enzyme family protein [Candidatus Parabeggiatoa sp. nov. 3]|nr:MAG: formylglycine-generating enzyme family protein [Gammaproteobacteria bacterium]RKZ55208.1 MAG: formylglycine-generating enzyme family protein [Gammaproteobacteria bacterium]RKZ87184.1 MAG: formylglycine-generating enzyme family protein [Gammaproteobacteria bacterium]